MNEIQALLILILAFVLKKITDYKNQENNVMSVQNFYAVKSLLSEAINNTNNQQDKIEFTNTLELMNQVERKFNV